MPRQTRVHIILSDLSFGPVDKDTGQEDFVSVNSCYSLLINMKQDTGTRCLEMSS